MASEVRAFIALGGNLGPVPQHIAQALELLDAAPGTCVGRVSDLFRTAPVGEHAGQAFLNAAAELQTALPPLELLDHLQEIERQLGRVRTVHWGPRTIDIDLVLYGDQILDEPRLQVPHPACWYRRFVLDPLCQIAGDVLHPEKRCSFATLRGRLLGRPLHVALAGGDAEFRETLREAIQPEFPAARFERWPARTAADEPALIVWLGPAVGGASGEDFEQLPPIARLDGAAAANPVEFVRGVLQAALDAPQRV
jgi:2-amino-4-hydroxy-6-hydroxymethyldihydropteridine diphosphokinase